MGRVDVALEEYRALRAELIARGQAQTTLVSVALTATAVIAGFAFGAKAGEAPRLPAVLAGTPSDLEPAWFIDLRVTIAALGMLVASGRNPDRGFPDRRPPPREG